MKVALGSSVIEKPQILLAGEILIFKWNPGHGILLGEFNLTILDYLME